MADAIARTSDTTRLRTVIRLTRSYYESEWPSRIADASLRSEPRFVNKNDTFEVCLPYVQEFDAEVLKLEEFGLALVDADRFDQLLELFRVIETWISYSERTWPGTSFRPVVGTPSLLALRLLANWTAKALDNSRVDGAASLLRTPIQAEDHTGKVTIQPTIERGHMFYSDAFLGFADLTTRYLEERSWTNEGLRTYFASEADYQHALAVALFMVDFLYVALHPEQEARIYPAYRQIEDGTNGVSRFLQRVSIDPALLAAFARAVDEDPATFKQRWPDRIKPINEAELGTIWDRRGRSKLQESL